jgi:hypothetical protein
MKMDSCLKVVFWKTVSIPTNMCPFLFFERVMYSLKNAIWCLVLYFYLKNFCGYSNCFFFVYIFASFSAVNKKLVHLTSALDSFSNPEVLAVIAKLR